jgi:hypothetical protein
VAITPHLLIGFASEYMHWKALLRDFSTRWSLVNDYS